MAEVPRPTKSQSGTRDYEIGDSFLAAEINADLNTIYDEFNGSIGSANLADGAVTASKLGSLAVETAKIAAEAVTTAKIAPDAIDGTLIADIAVDSEHIADNAVEAAHIADNAVNTAQIVTDAVTNVKIDDEAVKANNIALGFLYEAEKTYTTQGTHIDTFEFTLTGTTYPTTIPLMPYVTPTSLTGGVDITVENIALTELSCVTENKQFYMKLRVTVVLNLSDEITYQVKWPSIGF